MEGNQEQALVRREDGLNAVTTRAAGMEVANRAIEAQVRAAVEARFIVAMRNPRSWPTVRQKLIELCRDPGFAEAGWFRKPIGEGVEGFTIRFAEAAAQSMGNVQTNIYPTWDDDEFRVLQVEVTDLESNNTHAQSITIHKSVERSYVREGLKVYGQRAGSKGSTVYTVEATEDDFLAKENARVSKAKRNGLLGLLPAELKAECKAIIKKTKKDKRAVDPKEGIKKIADSFSKIGITASALEEWVGHSLDSVSPSEVEDLRDLYTLIDEEGQSWSELLEDKKAERELREAKRANLKAQAQAVRSKADAIAGRKEVPSESSTEGQASKQDPSEEPETDGEADATSAAPKTATVSDFWREVRRLKQMELFGDDHKEQALLYLKSHNAESAKDLSPEKMGEALSGLEPWAVRHAAKRGAS